MPKITVRFVVMITFIYTIFYYWKVMISIKNKLICIIYVQNKLYKIFNSRFENGNLTEQTILGHKEMKERENSLL